eukprot:476081-Prorocentrum_minimum.AAC.2
MHSEVAKTRLASPVDPFCRAGLLLAGAVHEAALSASEAGVLLPLPVPGLARRGGPVPEAGPPPAPEPPALRRGAAAVGRRRLRLRFPHAAPPHLPHGGRHVLKEPLRSLQRALSNK